ncbi:MAG: hypothetical protein ACLUTU_04250 [Blautia faecis]
MMALPAGTIVENSREWLDMTTQIKEAENAVADYDNTIEELKQQQIGVYYEEQFERAAEKVDRFRDKLDGLKALISDDMKIDKNTGLLTESECVGQLHWMLMISMLPQKI